MDNLKTKEELTAELLRIKAEKEKELTWHSPEIRELLACERCGHVRRVKVMLLSGGASWNKLCSACDYEARAAYKERMARDFRARAAEIRRKRKERG